MISFIKGSMVTWFPLREWQVLHQSVPRYKTNQKSTTEVKQKWSETAAFWGDAEAGVNVWRAQRGAQNTQLSIPCTPGLAGPARGSSEATEPRSPSWPCPALGPSAPRPSPALRSWEPWYPKFFLFFVCNNQVRYCYIPFIYWIYNIDR